MRHTRADISNPTTTGAPPHLAYRSDIDGLRGFAVVAVVAYHFYPTTVPGGFIGVDVFFVISGYLISSIILGALLDGSFNFTNFYVRRARRIFPALVVVLSFCFCLGWYTLLPDEFDRLNRNVAAGAGFVSNFQLWSEGGYFDTAANKKPLLHLWSLGIEEQFYLVWPLLLYITIRWHLRPLWTIVVIMVLSFALNLFVIRTHQNAAFYLPLTRFWELMIGGLIAWVEQRNRAPIHTFFPARLVPYFSGFGATLIFASSGFYHDKIEYPGLWALAPVAGTAAIIAAGPQCWINRNLLSGRLPVGVGLISYPLYLWHWPFLTFGRIIEPLWITKTGRIILLGVSFAAAIATYRYIEQPIRRSTPTARLGLSLAGTLAVICVAALVAVGASVPPRNNDPGLEKIIQALRDWDYPTRAFQTMKFHGAKFYSQTSHRSEVTLFIGDSLMAQYAPRISQQVSAHPDRTTSVIFATEGGCWPIPYVLQNSNLNCQRTMNAAFELAKRNDVTRIALAANWASFAKDFEPRRNICITGATFGAILVIASNDAHSQWPRGPRI